MMLRKSWSRLQASQNPRPGSLTQSLGDKRSLRLNAFSHAPNTSLDGFPRKRKRGITDENRRRIGTMSSVGKSNHARLRRSTAFRWYTKYEANRDLFDCNACH